MPTFRKKYRIHPWHARAKRYDIEYHLGFFATREEAIAAEKKFSAHYPPDARGKRAIHVRENA